MNYQIESLSEKNQVTLNERFSQLDKAIQSAYATAQKNPECRKHLENVVLLFDIIKMKNDEIVYQTNKHLKNINS